MRQVQGHSVHGGSASATSRHHHHAGGASSTGNGNSVVGRTLAKQQHSTNAAGHSNEDYLTTKKARRIPPAVCGTAHIFNFGPPHIDIFVLKAPFAAASILVHFLPLRELRFCTTDSPFFSPSPLKVKYILTCFSFLICSFLFLRL